MTVLASHVAIYQSELDKNISCLLPLVLIYLKNKCSILNCKMYLIFILTIRHFYFHQTFDFVSSKTWDFYDHTPKHFLRFNIYLTLTNQKIKEKKGQVHTSINVGGGWRRAGGTP